MAFLQQIVLNLTLPVGADPRDHNLRQFLEKYYSIPVYSSRSDYSFKVEVDDQKCTAEIIVVSLTLFCKINGTIKH